METIASYSVPWLVLVWVSTYLPVSSRVWFAFVVIMTIAMVLYARD